MSAPGQPESPAQPPTCYRHPGRRTHLRCNRCERYICGDCMRAAAVGHQCVECVQAGARTIRQPRTRFGGPRPSGSPVVTYALIAVNVAVFLAQLASGGLEEQLALRPPAVADGQLYRLATSAFLHYGAMHLLLNMWALYVVGPPLEIWLGRLRFGAVYALSGLGGSVLVYLLSPLNTATAGASGAIFGLFAAAFVVAKRLTLDVRGIGVVIVVNLMFTFGVPAVGAHPISWQAHVGGLVTGAAVAAAYVYAPSQRRNAVHIAVTIVALVVCTALIWWRTTDILTEFGGHLNRG